MTMTFLNLVFHDNSVITKFTGVARTRNIKDFLRNLPILVNQTIDTICSLSLPQISKPLLFSGIIPENKVKTPTRSNSL